MTSNSSESDDSTDEQHESTNDPFDLRQYQSDQLNRSVDIEERVLLREIQHECRRVSGTNMSFNLVNIADQANVAPGKARRIARNWTNEGLYTHGGAVDFGRLTPYGMAFSFHPPDEVNE